LVADKSKFDADISTDPGGFLLNTEENLWIGNVKEVFVFLV
jgi:hypothetical protein